MKTKLFGVEVIVSNMHIPESENIPYTPGSDAGNSFIEQTKLIIKDEHIQDLLSLLEQKGYNISQFMNIQ